MVVIRLDDLLDLLNDMLESSEHTSDGYFCSLILKFLDDGKSRSIDEIRGALDEFMKGEDYHDRIPLALKYLEYDGSIRKDESGLYSISELPSDNDFQTEILKFIGEGKSKSLDEIKNFCINRFGIQRELIDDCLDEIFMPLINEGKIWKDVFDRYKIASKIEMPSESEIEELIGKILSDGRSHSAVEIQYFCNETFELEPRYKSSFEYIKHVMIPNAIAKLKKIHHNIV